MANCIRRWANKELGYAKGRGGPNKGTWWWNAYVQQVIMENKRCFIDWQKVIYLKSFELYKQDKRMNSEGRHRMFHCRVSAKEIDKVLKRMKCGKTVRPNDILIELWKCLGEIEIQWHNIVVLIYKNKGDIQNCLNYKGINLMSHTTKLWERVIEQRLRSLTT
ncbi:hypothetical protein UlMin_037312 [Ulmus minor]